MTEIVVMVADRHRLFAETLGRALELAPGLEVGALHFGEGHSAIDAAVAVQPDVVLYDFWMPGTSGPAAARYLASWAPTSSVLLLSWLHGPYQVREAYDAGASGMIPKSVSLAELTTAVGEVYAGLPLGCSEPVTRGVARACTGHESSSCWARLKSLTLRELAVLQLLSEGRSVPEVALGLGIARSTAKNHVHNILRKTATASAPEAVDLAQHEGLVGNA